MNLKEKAFAVVGASNNPEKYGHKVVEALKKISSNIYPINPKETQILGLRVFKKLNEVKENIDFVVFVTPPKISLEVLKRVRTKNIHFWFQPGSFDDKVTTFCKENELTFTNNKCIIVESKSAEMS